MAKDLVDQRNGGYYVAGTRVSLDSVVYACLRGESAEEIVESFPVLNLEQVSGALDFYFANKTLVEDYLKEQERAHELLYQEARQRDPAFYEKIDDARKKLRNADALTKSSPS